MKKVLLISLIIGVIIATGYGKPDTPLYLGPKGPKKEIKLKGSFKKISTKSLTLSPIDASIGTFGLDVVFLQDLGDLDVVVYSESGNIVYSERIDIQTQQYLSIDVSAWNRGIYQIRFINSEGLYMYGTFEVE
nr:DUF3244 domain-containing protein [uncultured Draconibacterium sp.]